MCDCDCGEMSPEMAEHYGRMLFDPEYEPAIMPRGFFEEWRKQEIERLYSPSPFRSLFREY